jgi:hypothetical protein
VERRLVVLHWDVCWELLLKCEAVKRSDEAVSGVALYLNRRLCSQA